MTQKTLFLSGSLVILSIMSLFVSLAQESGTPNITEQPTPQSNTRGAVIYREHCAQCHGENGYGIKSVAPAIRNPFLFGFEPITNQTIRLNEIDNYLETELRPLKYELIISEDLSEQQQIHLDELWEEEANLEEERIELVNARADFIDGFRYRIVVSEELKSRFGDLSLATNGHTDEYSNFSTYINRLIELEWSGDLDSYLYAVIGYGTASEVYVLNSTVNHAYSIRAGGNLSDDDIANVIAYIMTWDKNWELRDILFVRQYPIPEIPYYLEPTPTPQYNRETYIKELIREASYTIDDIESGKRSFNGIPYACIACHDGKIAPLAEDIWSMTVNERLKEEQFQRYTPEQYIMESILLPDAYIADGYTDGIMPDSFAFRLQRQELIDIVAYLKSIGNSD